MSVINRIAKFAAAQRVLEYQIGGYVFWSDIPSGVTPEQKAQQIAQALQSSGWGVRYSNGTWTAFNLSPRLYVYVNVGIDAPANENPERVKQGVLAVATQFLDSAVVTLSNDTLETPSANGQIIVTPTYDQSALEQPSLWNQVFGKDQSLVDTGGKILGVSVGTIALGVLGYFAVKNVLSGKRR